MIDQEIQQKLRVKYNPEGSELRCMQLRMLEMLKYIDKVCSENNIPYWLSSGTCLGAIRHGGFIPWDDDCDIEMLSQDYNRFINIIANDHECPYKIQTRKNDPGYFLTFGKLRDLKSEIKEGNASEKTTYKYNGIYIDIFPMERSNSRRVSELISKIFFHLYVKGARINGSILNRFWNGVLMNIIIAPLSLLNKIGTRNRLRHKNPGGFPWERYYNDIFPLKRCDFEGISLPVPNNCERYLNNIYGNYMELPDLSKIELHTVDVKIW